MTDSDRPTLIPCLACGGDFLIFEEITSKIPVPVLLDPSKETRRSSNKYRQTRCAWCDSGGMSPEQVSAYRDAHPHRV